MLRAALTILFALCLAIVAFAAQAPATLLDRRLAAATAGGLRLIDADGTVWRGRGAIGDAQGRWRVPVAWTIAPLALAQGALDVTFDPRGHGDPGGRAVLTPSSVELRDATLALPAEAVGSFMGDRPLPEPGGTLHLEAPSFRYDLRAGNGAIVLRWERARLVWNGAVVELGTVRGRIAPRGAELTGTLGNAGGALRIDGDFSASATNATVRATLTPGPDVPVEIARLLAALGRADSTGAVRVEWRSGAR
jgi:general secretion pathway protein N